MDTRNKILSISEIQRNLRELYRNGELSTSVVIDGVYGDVTRNAVTEFQSLFGLPVTGIVDYITWTELAERARESVRRRQRSEPIYPFEILLQGGTISPGDASDIVYLIQLMLRTLGAYNFTEIPLNGIYDENTRLAIEQFQRINGLDDDGEIDKETWNALAAAYNKYNKPMN